MGDLTDKEKDSVNKIIKSIEQLKKMCGAGDSPKKIEPKLAGILSNTLVLSKDKWKYLHKWSEYLFIQESFVKR